MILGTGFDFSVDYYIKIGYNKIVIRPSTYINKYTPILCAFVDTDYRSVYPLAFQTPPLIIL